LPPQPSSEHSIGSNCGLSGDTHNQKRFDVNPHPPDGALISATLAPIQI
jgi:hypothetical protein